MSDPASAFRSGNGMPEKPQPGSTSARGERRVVTALFCDVANSTALAGDLDPEEWVDQIEEAFGYLTDAIARYEGTVVRLLGDAVLAFFGAPLAHEDDPERAVLAGLSMIEAIRPFQTRFQREFGMEFDIRVGINTGEVVFGRLVAGGDESTAMGDAVNIAARMQQLAAPNTVQVSADTYGMIASLFEVEPLGEIDVKGKREVMAAYRVVRYRPLSRALHDAAKRGAPLVGRVAEMAQIRRVVEEFRDGRGQALLIISDTGLGKTRMIDELHRLVATGEASSANWSQTRGISYDMARPYGVVQTWLRHDLRIDDATPDNLVATSVTRRVNDVTGDANVSLVQTIQSLLTGAASLSTATEEFQHDVIDSVGRFYRALAASTGLILVADDLHWADAASAELLSHLLSLVDETQTLLVCAFRPERQSTAWSVKHQIETQIPHRLTAVELQPLTEEDSARLVDEHLRGRDAPAALRSAILQKTGGNPLFVEEVVRALADRALPTPDSSSDALELVIPDSLQALLTARIDNLDRESRRLLQLASVIGRYFSVRILERVIDDASGLGRLLNSLERFGLIEETQRIPERQFGFRHELMRDAVYRSILRRDRQRFHRLVAETLEARTMERSEDVAHQLAHHFREAGDLDRALPYAVRAGERAQRLYAVAEAVAHYTSAIELLAAAGAPGSQAATLRIARAALLAVQGEFDRAERDYQVALDVAQRDSDRIFEWRALEGLGALWFGRDYDRSGEYIERALALAREIGDARTLAQSLLQRGNWQGNVSEMDDARESLQSARELFEELGDLRGVAQAEDLLGILVESDSDFTAFLAHTQRAMELYRQVDDRQGLVSTLAILGGMTASIFFKTYVKPPDISEERALVFTNEALAIAREIGWRSGESFALAMQSVVLDSLGRAGDAVRSAQSGIAIAEKINHLEWSCGGHAVLSYIYDDLLQDDLALSHIEQAHVYARESGLPFWVGITAGHLAIACVKAGDFARARSLLASVTDSLPMNSQVRRHLWAAQARVDTTLGDFASAVAIIDRLFDTAANLTSRRDIPPLAYDRAEALLGAGRIVDALESIDEAIAGASVRAMQTYRWRMHDTRARILLLLDAPEQAQAERERAVEIVRSIAASIDDNDLRTRFLVSAHRLIGI